MKEISTEMGFLIFWYNEFKTCEMSGEIWETLDDLRGEQTDQSC